MNIYQVLYKDNVSNIVISPDSNILIATYKNSITSWDLNNINNRSDYIYKNDIVGIGYNYPLNLYIIDDKFTIKDIKKIYYAKYSNNILIYNDKLYIFDKNTITLLDDDDSTDISAVNIDCMGNKIVAGSSSGNIKIWDLITKKKITINVDEPINTINIDGDILVYSNKNNIKILLYDKLLYSINTNTGIIDSLSISDNKQWVVATTTKGYLLLIDIVNGCIDVQIKTCSTNISDISITDKYIAIINNKNKITVYDLNSIKNSQWLPI
jgi:WD40 repeat protein